MDEKSIHTCSNLGKCTTCTADYVLNSEGQNERGSPNHLQHSILEQGEDFAVLPLGKPVFGAGVQNLPAQKGQKCHILKREREKKKRKHTYTLINSFKKFWRLFSNLQNRIFLLRSYFTTKANIT